MCCFYMGIAQIALDPSPLAIVLITRIQVRVVVGNSIDRVD